jgi:chloramphenicol 3-O phosphotransferase
MMLGKLILLNGTTCSGKTSIVTALQAALPEPYLAISIKSFLCMPGQDQHALSRSRSSPHASTLVEDDTAAELATQMVANMHQSILALIDAGHNVIAEHMLREPAWLRACARQFYARPAWFVGVRCPLAVTEQRTKENGQYQPGQVQVQSDRVHAPGVYDLEVDTDAFSPSECALQIHRRMIDKPIPLALSWLNAYTSPDKYRGWLRSTELVLPAVAA